MKINFLPEETIRKISAGEFVNKLYKILKELLENSLDANSSEIKIYLLNNGLDLIKIVDNGFGIKKNDLLNIIKRDFTNKIYYFKDLNKINTFGFRGKTLSSISSISNIFILSKTKYQRHGWMVFNNSNNFLNFYLKPVLHKVGTTIIIKNICLYKKCNNNFSFLKYNEWILIKNIIYNIVISNYKVKFSIYKDNKLWRKYNYFRNNYLNFKNSVISIYGKNIFSNYIKINIKNVYFNNYGFFFLNTNKINIIYLNKRIISKDNILYLIINKFIRDNYNYNYNVSYILFFLINYKEINLNISPDKKKILFINPSFWFNEIYNSYLLFFKKKNVINSKYLYINKKKKKYINKSNDYIQYFINNFGYIINIFNNRFLCTIKNKNIIFFDLYIIYYYFNIFILKGFKNILIVKKNVNKEILINKINIIDKYIINIIIKLGIDFYLYNNKIIIKSLPLELLGIKLDIFFKNLFFFYNKHKKNNNIIKILIYWISDYFILNNIWNNYKSMLLISRFYEVYFNLFNNKFIIKKFFFIVNFSKISLYMLDYLYNE